jgi:hypothetical protein
MKVTLVIFLLLTLASIMGINSNSDIPVRLHDICGYSTSGTGLYYCGPASTSNEKLVSRMVAYSGFDDRINVKESQSVESAVIGLDTANEVTIIVNTSLFKNNPNGIKLAILSHEIGHLFKRHLSEKKRIPFKKKELGADVYSGFWCQRASVKLIWPLQALNDFPEDTMYPPKKERMDSVNSGYKLAGTPFEIDAWTGNLPDSVLFAKFLSLFVAVTPYKNKFFSLVKYSGKFNVNFHLTSTDVMIPIDTIIRRIKYVEYTIDSSFGQPVFKSDNPNNDNFGYLLTKVYGEFPISAKVYFRDNSTSSIVKSFTLK